MDDFYDPDLEARLYAEVHYTNDTYSETNNCPRALAPEGDVIPGSIRSYAKKTGMFPKKHRALIDGVRAVGNHRVQEPVPRQEFRSNQSDVTKTIPSLLSLDPAIPPRFTSANPPRFLLPNPPRFSSSNPPRYLLPTPPRFIPPNSSRFLLPNPPRLNSSISSRLGPQISPIPTGVTPLDSSRTNLFGKYPPDYPRSGHQLDPATISFDNSRLPSNTFNQATNFQLNPFASDSFNSSLLDPYSSPRQDLPRFNQPDFIRLTQSLPNESKAQARKNSHMTNLKKLGKKVRNRRRREKIRSRKAVKGNKISIVETSPSTPRKNPNRAARSSDLNKSHDGTKGVVNLDDSIEVIEIQESTDDNLTHSNSGSPAGNHEMSQDESADELHESQKCLDEFDENLGKSGDDNLDKSGDSLEKSDSSDKSKNLEMPNKNLDKSDGNLRTPNKNLDKSNKNLDKSGKNLDKSNDNLETPSKDSEQSDHNLDKTKNSNKSDENLTPSKNLDKSNRNFEKSDENLAKSNENVDKAENPQESGTPTKTPEKSKDTNLTSKSSPGPSSKDKNSKYNIKSPSKVSKSMASLDSSSDSESDGSIFEVPVPPKPAPPLINLNDSDESDESDSEEDSNDAPSKNNLEDDENENDEEESSEKQIWDCDDDDDDDEEDEEEENSDSQKQVWNCEDDDVDDLDNHEENEEDTIVTNFVLNCSQVQKTVPTLEELRKVNLTNLEAKDDPPVLETITDTNEASTSTTTTTTTTTTMITEDSGDKSRQPPPKSLGSDKKRPRDESRNRDDSLNPLKVSRCDNSKENTSFEEYVSKPMPVPLKAFYTDYRNSGCMNDVMDIQHKMSRNPNLWAILDADLVCRGGDKRLKCSYCHQPGHKRENCPDKRKPVTCHMCGEGGHSESRCPQRMCLTCGKKYSSYRKTCEYCRKLQCALCKSTGHLKIDCPDLWRRYHHTTTSGSVNIPPNPQEVLKPSHKLYCCNCTRRGHESSTCSRYRWSSHFPSPISVTSYTDGPSYPIREPVEIPPEAPIGIPDPSAPDVIVFHYQNRSEIPDNWCSDTIYPLEIPSISYNLESSKHQFPEFLTQHFPEESFYPIYVLIKLTVPDKLVVELKTPSAPSTLELKKLIIQWMSRREEDRKRMTQATRLPTRKAYLLNIMLNKFYSFITYSSLRGLTAYDEEFASQKRANILRSKMERRSDNSEKCKLRLTNQLANLEERFIKKLVSSLYNFKLAPSAEAIINDFHKLLNLLSTDNAWEGDEGRQSRVPQSMYMNFCWFNFELFTAHLSDYLVHAKESFQKQYQQGDSRITKKKGQSAKDLGLQLMFTRPERINFLSEGCKPGVLKVNKCKKNHIKYAKKLQCRAKLRAKNKRQKNKNTDNEGVTADSSENNDSSQTIGGSGNNDSSKNIDGSGNIESSKNPGGSKNNGGSKNSDGSKKPKEKPTSLIVDGKINVQVLQREKLACRAQAAVDLAKKHGLTKYVDRAEEIVKKIKAGGTVKKNTIEQLWSFLVKELRGNNISFQN